MTCGRYQYFVRLTPRRIGYLCQFGCNFPDGENIGWVQGPGTWRPTRASAERWGQRKRARREASDTPPLAVEEILL